MSKEVLERAAEIVENGWTTKWFAVYFGQKPKVQKEKIIPFEVPSTSEKATHFCMLGAVHRALNEIVGEGWTSEHRRPLLEAILKAGGGKTEIVGELNDSLESGEQAAEILRKAKEYV
jgi:hypothetical protein